MPRIGYARVSTTSQDRDIQQAKLKEAGCEIIRAETFEAMHDQFVARSKKLHFSAVIKGPFTNPLTDTRP